MLKKICMGMLLTMGIVLQAMEMECRNIFNNGVLRLNCKKYDGNKFSTVISNKIILPNYKKFYELRNTYSMYLHYGHYLTQKIDTQELEVSYKGALVELKEQQKEPYFDDKVNKGHS